MFNAIHNFIFTPQAMRGTSVDLWIVYLAWGLVLVAIYPLCRWWAD